MILVDASDPADLEDTVELEKVVEIIDHRLMHRADAFPNADAHIEPVGATATLIAERFMRSDIEISKESAALLFGGIISNTLNFRGSMTTNRDKDAAGWLNAIARLPEGFWRELFMAKSDVAGDKLVRRIEDDFARLRVGDKNIGIAELELIGVRRVLEERGDEIRGMLERMTTEMRLDFVFLNATELEEVATCIVAIDDETRQLLARALDISFDGSMALLPHPLMRKQITPLLKKALE